MIKRPIVFVVSSIHCLLALAFQDPLTTSAEMTVLAPKAVLTSMAHAGDRLFAVGQRGIIVYADPKEAELKWRQSSVPVSADLTSVAFPSSRSGWAVGHGAVILHTTDQGSTWVKQTDGKALGESALKYFEASADALDPDRRDAVLGQARRLANEKEAQPLLDVWFKDERTGFVVGTFNRLFRTEDGGAQWLPLIDRIDNPQELHFYAVRGSGNEVFIAGERGMVWRWEDSKARFVAVQTPYDGSLFGLIVTPRVVLAYGMRGSLFKTSDRGRTWKRIDTGLRAGIVAGDVRANGDIVLVAQSGDAIISTDEGEAFRRLPLSHRDVAAGILSISSEALVLAGPGGVREEIIAPAAKR